MNFITKKSIPRRSFIKGVGGTIALPLLNAMVPAATAARAVVQADAADLLANGVAIRLQIGRHHVGLLWSMVRRPS